MELSDSEHNTFCKHQLFQHVVDGKSRKIQKILERDGSISVDVTNNKGQTLLYVSCLYRRLKVAIVLLQFGADPNYRSDDGSTPTHAAAYSCCPDTLRYVVEDYGGDMRLHDEKMRTPRDWAIRAGKNVNKKVLRLIQSWQEQVDKKMSRPEKFQRGAAKVSKSEEMLKRNLEIDYCGYGSFLHPRKIPNSGYVGVAAVVPLALPNHITSSGSISLRFNIPPSLLMEEALWCNHKVMIKRGKGKNTAMTQAAEDLLIAEAKACRMLRHPNLLLLMAICFTSPDESYPGAPDHWLVYEYSSLGTLYHVLHETKTNFLPTDIAKILIQIANALCFVHQRGFIHGAITSHAIYLSDNSTAKLGNMCCVSYNKPGASVPAAKSVSPHFNRWLAPEVILKGSITTKVDVYSLCIVISEGFSGSLPWYGCDDKSIEDHIKKRRNYFVLPDWLPKELNEVLENGLKYHSHNRTITVCDIKECISTLMQNGKFNEIVACLRESKSSKVCVCKTVSSEKIKMLDSSMCYPSMEETKTSHESLVVSGMDVPDARPFVTSDHKEISTSERSPGGGVNEELENIQKNSENYLTTASVDLQKLRDNSGMKSSSAHELDLPHLRKQNRPHSCSIVTQDGLVREFLLTSKHNSYPDITVEQSPPSYSTVAKQVTASGAKPGLNGKLRDNPESSTFILPVKGPPCEAYSPTCLEEPVTLFKGCDLQMQGGAALHSNETSKSLQNYETQTQQIKRINDPCLSRLAATTDLEYKKSCGANTQSRHSCQVDASAPLLGQSSKVVKDQSEVLHRPNSLSLQLDKVCSHSEHDNNINTPEFSSDGRVWRKPARLIQHSQSLYIPANCALPDIPVAAEDVPDAVPLRIRRCAPGHRKHMQDLRNRKMRWSTSALVGRKNINYAEYSPEEMYDIGNDDLECIFESFAGRKSLDQLPPNYVESFEHDVEPQLHPDCFDSKEASPTSMTLFIPPFERPICDTYDLGSVMHQRSFTDCVDSALSRTELQKKSMDSPVISFEEKGCNGYNSEHCASHSFPKPDNPNSSKTSIPAASDIGKFSRGDVVQSESVSGLAAFQSDSCAAGAIPNLDHESVNEDDRASERGAREEEFQVNNITQGQSRSLDSPGLSFLQGARIDKESEFSDARKVCSASLRQSYPSLASDNDNSSSLEFVIPIHTDVFECDSLSHHSVSDTYQAQADKSTETEWQSQDPFSIQNRSEVTRATSSAVPELVSRGTNTIEQYSNYWHSPEHTQSSRSASIKCDRYQDSMNSAQFLTCLEQEEEEKTSIARSVIKETSDMDSNLSGGSDAADSNDLEDGFSSNRKPQEAGESVSALPVSPTCSGKYETDLVYSHTELEGVGTHKTTLENDDVTVETPSKWTFQKKLTLFKVAADSENVKNLEKKVLTQNTLSKVRQTAELYEKMSPVSSPRDVVPPGSEKSTYFHATNDDSCSTVDSSKFVQGETREKFDTSTPVSTSNQLLAHCRSAITPRTFDEVRRDIETASAQKCHFIDGSNRECAHHAPDEAISDSQIVGSRYDDTSDEQQTSVDTVNSSDSATASVGPLIAESGAAPEEFQIDQPKIFEVRKMVQNVLQGVIQTALSTLSASDNNDLDAATSHSLRICDTATEDMVAIGADSNISSEIKTCKSLPSVLNIVNEYEPTDFVSPNVRSVRSMSDLDSFHLNVSREGYVQEFSSFLSEMEGRQHTSHCYRSVDTSVWSL